MYPDPQKQQLTKEDASAMAVNTFAIGFAVAFVLWLALDWSEIEKVTTVQACLNEILTGIQNALPGGVLACFSMWTYRTFLKE